MDTSLALGKCIAADQEGKVDVARIEGKWPSQQSSSRKAKANQCGAVQCTMPAFNYKGRMFAAV